MPYLLFLKKRQNLKLSSAANYRLKLGRSVVHSKGSSPGLQSLCIFISLKYIMAFAEELKSNYHGLKANLIYCIHAFMNIKDQYLTL